MVGQEMSRGQRRSRVRQGWAPTLLKPRRDGAAGRVNALLLISYLRGYAMKRRVSTYSLRVQRTSTSGNHPGGVLKGVKMLGRRARWWSAPVAAAAVVALGVAGCASSASNSSSTGSTQAGSIYLGLIGPFSGVDSSPEIEQEVPNPLIHRSGN